MVPVERPSRNVQTFEIVHGNWLNVVDPHLPSLENPQPITWLSIISNVIQAGFRQDVVRDITAQKHYRNYICRLYRHGYFEWKLFKLIKKYWMLWYIPPFFLSKREHIFLQRYISYLMLTYKRVGIISDKSNYNDIVNITNTGDTIYEGKHGGSAAWGRIWSDVALM